MANATGDYGVTAPATHASAVTPSNSATLSPVPRALYVGTAGNVVVDTAGGETDITFANVPAGTVLPVYAAKVKTTTTASNIVAIY